MNRPTNLLLLLTAVLLSCQPDPYDLLIRNGTVYDGSGAEGYAADIAIRGDAIVRIAPGIKGAAIREIDAAGKAVSPGFVDLHTHIESLPLNPEAESHLQQGATTALGGPDGGSPILIDEYLDSLGHQGTGLNVAYLIGHNTIRNHVMGLENRAPTPAELAEMKTWVERGMAEGAFGISTGLKYLPGAYSKVDEVIELSKIAGRMGGIYTSHLREEGLGLLQGVGEAIQISREADIPVVLTHHKVVGFPMWGASERTLTMVDSARKAGLDIMIDQYPYTASYTSLSILIPAWSMAGGRYDKFAERCQDPVLRDSIKEGIIFNLINDRGGNDLRRVQFSKFDWKPQYEGKTLYDWATDEGLEPTMENGAELIIQAQLHRGARCIFHAMDEADVVRILQHPQTMVASDGRVTVFEQGHPHPRVYGTFPRVLGYFTREQKALTLPQAIHKMTGLPARRMGLTDRGQLQEGYKADVVVFDPGTIIDRATFLEPHQFPVGIDYVIVNGQVAVEHGVYQEVRAGQILRGPAYPK